MDDIGKMIRVLKYFFMLAVLHAHSANAERKYDFFQLSNIKDALEEGDCQRFGGYKYNGDVAKLAVLLNKQGKRVGTYNNVKQFNGNTYVMWGYRSGFIFVSTTLEWCVFK